MNHLRLFESFDDTFFESVDTVWDVISHLENEFTIEYNISNLITGSQFSYQELNRKAPMKLSSFNITLTPDKKISTKDFVKELEAISQMCINMSENIRFDFIYIFNLDSFYFRKLPISLDPKDHPKWFSIKMDAPGIVGTISLKYHS